ncbi:hypothetical protein [Microbacterium sp. NPDC058389]|uniref:hypothetical protein n=1 Tax=Microbacterium sp. NPDC058389 TaxID=3346475 RepID=UPI0036526EDD
MKLKIRLAAIAALAAAGIIGAAIPASASSLSTGEIQELPMEESVPIPLVSTVVTIDVATGEVLSSEPAPVTPFITQLGPGCSTDAVCLYAPSAPYYGFINAGTLNGSWAGRTSYYTGWWTTQLKWQSGGSTVTGPKLGRYVTANLVGGPVTVTQVRIF